LSKISFEVIAHNTEQCGFGSALPPKEPHITPVGQFTPSLGTTGLSFVANLRFSGLTEKSGRNLNETISENSTKI